MGDGHSSNCLHGLNRNRSPKIKTYKNFKDAKGYENSQWIHSIKSNITHDKRDQRPQIAKGASKLHLVIVVAPQSHGHLFTSIPPFPPFVKGIGRILNFCLNLFSTIPRRSLSKKSTPSTKTFPFSVNRAPPPPFLPTSYRQS